MIAETVLFALLKAQAAMTGAILVVLAARPFARAAMGPRLAYRLWALVPLAGVVTLFPTLSEFTQGEMPTIWFGRPSALHPAAWITEGAWPLAGPVLGAWAAGAVVLATIFALAEWRFRRLARRGLAGPALIGVAWPRMVTPADYEQRFTARERTFIRAHERAHFERRDPLANLLIATLQVLGWFNPLSHLAAAAARLDQEMACDATVVEFRPKIRRGYAEALLKAHIDARRAPVACAWSPLGRHPLELRLRQLGRPALSLAQHTAGSAAVGLLALILALTIWALEPRGIAGPSFNWSALPYANIQAVLLASSD
jgi:beta-lactamase regulating signal transducer with metallopeptidase domain